MMDNEHKEPEVTNKSEKRPRYDIEEIQKRMEVKGGGFRAGEILLIRGTLFRVQSVKPKKLILKVAPRIKEG